jgi:hypothetical protein
MRKPRVKRPKRVKSTPEQLKYNQQQWAIKRKFAIMDHLFNLGQSFDTIKL